jgi:hypothetical protein
VQETYVLRGFTIEILLFRVKAKKILDFLIKHRDLNPINQHLLVKSSRYFGRFLEGYFSRFAEFEISGRSSGQLCEFRQTIPRTGDDNNNAKTNR